MIKRAVAIAVLLSAIFLLVSCSSNQPGPSAEPKAKAEPKSADLITARDAFQKLYISARNWAPDAKPFRIQSDTTSDANGQGGKSAIWRASFASPSRRSIKTYLWSGTDVGGGSRGVSPGTEDTYNPSNSATQVFDSAFLKVDSDKAFSVAQEHGGEKLTKQSANQPVMYVLDWAPSQNKLIWHVTYGMSRMDSKLNVAVDATTGSFLRLEK